MARSFREARRSIFFDATAFVAKTLADRPECVEEIRALLAAPPAPAEGQVRATRPEDVLDRMAAIDLLQAVEELGVDAAASRAARTALYDLALGAVAMGAAADGSKKIIAGERHDAFVALARTNATAAFSALRAVPSTAQRRFFLSAVYAGLVDRGTRRSDLDEIARQNGVDPQRP